MHRIMKTELNNTERASQIFLAILIASLIWGLAINQENFSVTEKLSVIPDIPENHCILEQSCDSIQVVFWGSGWEMLNFQFKRKPDELTKLVPVSDGSNYPTQQTMTIETTEIQITDHISIRQIQPNQLTVITDTIISKQLPVAVVTSEGIPSRYINVIVEPSFITITGPSSTVLRMDSIATVPINLLSGPTPVPLEVTTQDVRYSTDIVQVSIVEPVFPVPI